MKAWTDYPFTELGDEPHKEAPIRQVDVISYDGDKYCRVRFNDIEKEIKSGYIYQAAGRIGEVPLITRSQLLSLVNDAQ